MGPELAFWPRHQQGPDVGDGLEGLLGVHKSDVQH
jgi:hypothetical protein